MHTRDLIRFLAELSENNNRAWFVMNKPRYDILRAEFLELVTALIAGIARFDPAVADCNPKKTLFRIHRDLRFAKDKSPYKTHFAAAITASGLKKPSQGGGPAYYFHIDADGKLLAAGGEYLPPAGRLLAIRHQVIADPEGFSRVLKDRKLKARYGALREEDKLSRPPKGFALDGPHAEVLKLKSFSVWQETNLTEKAQASLEKDLLAAFRDAWPLVQWLRQIPAAPG